MKIARAIRELRQSRALSLSELARRCRLNRGHLHGLENEKFVPGVKTLIKISEGLNIEARRLLTLTTLEVVAEDDFVCQIRPFLPRLSSQQRDHVLRTLKAAPKVSRPASA